MLRGSTRESYRPRAAALERWRKDAPPYVVDCFYHEKEPREPYTVFVGGEHLWKANESLPHSPSNTHLVTLYVSPHGVVSSDSMVAWKAVQYRYQQARRHRVAWNDLPKAVREGIEAFMEDY